MANRMKEDEKNEKIIRGLLKLHENRRCINCNSRGPQYVCTNFWTFICTTCSGIHREFTHRVKSISMAKFTSQEVSALQGGGNERAKEVFFKEWDPQRHYLPDSSNIEKLRDFIKHVYVDKRYTGEKSIDRPPRVKMGGREESGENRRLNAYTCASRSPPYEDKREHRYGDKNQKYTDERQSPGYDRDYRRSPAHFEIVDDRRRDDRNRKGPHNSRPEDPRFSNGAPKPEARSPIHQRDRDLPSPPLVRPVRDILGEDVPPLRVGEPPKANASKAADTFPHAQRTASSSSIGSTEGNSVELKRENSGSLINFNADPEPPVVAALANDSFSGQTVNRQPANAPSSSGDSNWASFSFSGQDTAPSHAINTLESQLSQLSDLASGPIDPVVSAAAGGGGVTTQSPTNASIILESALSQVSASSVQSVGHMSTLPMQQQPSPSPGANSGSTFLQFTPPVTELPNNQRTASSSSLGSTEGNSVELKRENSGSLIDFNADPEPPVVAALTNDSFSGQTVNQKPANAQSSSGDSNWASFSFSGQDKAPSHAINTLESQLSQLSDLASGPIDPVVSGGGGVTTQSSKNASIILESALSQVPASSVQSVVHMSTLPMQQQPSPSPGANSGSTFLQFAPPVTELPNNQPWTSSVTQNAQGFFTFLPTGQPCQTPPKQLQETSVLLPQPPAPAEEKRSGRKELPENLFASSYGPAPVPIQRWQTAPPHVMAYAMQYPTSVLQSIPAIFPQPSQSTNPFDLRVEPSPVQAPTFPAIPLQGALPNIAAPSPLLQTSSFGTLSPQWASPRSPYPVSVPASAYMVPQATSGVSSLRHRGIGGYGNEGAAFGPFGGAPLPAAMYSQPSTPNSFSPLGGNPFG